MPRSARPYAVLWTLFGLALAGLAVLAAGLRWADPRIAYSGAAVLGLCALLSLALHAFAPSGPVPIAQAVAQSVKAAPRAIQFDYPALPSGTAHAGARTSPPDGEELVEFELVQEPRAPTHLVVPPAFQLEARVDAKGYTQRMPPLETGAAVRRRREMVSGLPLVRSILADDPPEAMQVSPHPAGKTRGQCSACGTMLWAPRERPIRLRCPRCGHVRTLAE